MKTGSGSNVILNRGSYYFRRRVPLDLVDVLEPGEVTKPLGTKVKREAERLARAYGSRLDVGYSMVRAGQVDEALADSLGSDRADEAAEAFSEHWLLFSEGVE